MRRIPRDEYLALKKFKKKVNSERIGNLVKDHRGHLYRVDENGSLQRCGRDDLQETIKESVPGVK